MKDIARKPQGSKEAAPREEVRAKIMSFENHLAKLPGAIFGDSDNLPLKHSFADGMYVREIFIPKGFVLTGKIHRHAHPNFLMSGEVVVVTEGKGREHLKGPLSMISAPGTKRAVLALTDVVWVTVHATEETDLEKIEDHVIAKSYDDPALLEAGIANKNCLILALREKGRDYSCLLDLKPSGDLLPFQAAMKRLKKAGTQLNDLFVTYVRGSDSRWHVSTNSAAGVPLSVFKPRKRDMVGAWVAVGVGGATVASNLFSNSKRKKPSAPDLSFLKDSSKFDYLKDTSGFDFLRDDADSNRFLEDPSAFQDTLGQFTGLSGVDQVRREVSGDYLTQLLAGIDEDTAKEAGALKMDFSDRGLGGPSQISDIEGMGLGELRGKAVGAKGKLRSDFLLKELGLMGDKESQMTNLLFGSAESEAGRDLSRELGLGDLLGSRDLGYANILNSRDLGLADNLMRQYSGQLGATPPKRGLLDGINLGFSF